MSIAICFVIIVTIAAAIADILKNKIDTTIPIAVISIVIIIYPFGFFRNLSAGVWTVCAISFCAICYLVIKLILAIKNKNLKEFISRVFTPGIVVYILFWIIFIFINKSRVLSVWDEFSHWGLVVKNMFVFDSYATNPETNILFREYPPFVSIFEYFFLKIKNYYIEEEIIIAVNVLFVSLILPIVRNVGWNKQMLKLLIYIPIIFVLPLSMFSDFYTTIYVDPILSIMMAYILYVFFSVEDDVIKCISVCLGLMSLPLIKASGSGLAIFILIIIFVDILIKRKKYLHDKKQLKKWLIIFIIFITCFLIGKYSWDMHIKLSNITGVWNISKITFKNIILLITGKGQSYQYIVVKSFINQFLYKPLKTDFGDLTNLHLLLIYVLYSVYMLHFYKKTDNDKYLRYKKLVFMLVSCYVLYMVALLVLYVFIYSEYEAMNLASYNRYSFTFLLAIYLYNTMCIIDSTSKKDTQKRDVLILIIILLFITPHNSIKKIFIKNKETKEEAIEFRENYKGINKYINKVEDGKKVYYISCGSKGLDYHISKYEMISGKIKVDNDSSIDNYNWSLGEPRFEGDIWSTNISLKEFENKLFNNSYDYVYVFKADDVFKDKYGELFKEEEIKDETMYKVNINKNKIILSELK